jgi:hypothetical protein
MEANVFLNGAANIMLSKNTKKKKIKQLADSVVHFRGPKEFVKIISTISMEHCPTSDAYSRSPD